MLLKCCQFVDISWLDLHHLRAECSLVSHLIMMESLEVMSRNMCLIDIGKFNCAS